MIKTSQAGKTITLRLEPFGEANIAEIAVKLGYDKTKAHQTAKRIEAAIVEVERWRSMSSGQVKRELASIRSLSNELDHASRAVHRILYPDKAARHVEEFAKRLGISREFLIAMQQTLNGLSQAANHIAGEPSLYRHMSNLPIEHQIKNKQLPEGRILWPVLFEIWEQAYGQPRSATKRLVEFIEFVHLHAELPTPVSENTVKSAIRVWAQMRRNQLRTVRLLQLKDLYGQAGE